MNEAVLLVGGNLSNRMKYLALAQNMIEQHVGTIQQKSSIYESAPWGFSSKQDFLNMVIVTETSLNVNKLLSKIHDIEHVLGRERKETTSYISRTIDIDILFFNDEIIDTPILQIPHPRIHERKFTLIPLYELMPYRIHPAFQKSIKQLLAECNDANNVHLFLHHTNI
jgi:2-amino-4-hydroxy-6-hydroxymethyldihydropteridine diphosphokinase